MTGAGDLWYSRRVRIGHATDLQAGDLVDVSSTAVLPYWCVVERVGTCDEDPEWEDYGCEGHCLAVIFPVVEEDGDAPWHVMAGEVIYARLLADADGAAVAEAENQAHGAAALARAVANGWVSAQ